MRNYFPSHRQCYYQRQTICCLLYRRVALLHHRYCNKVYWRFCYQPPICIFAYHASFPGSPPAQMKLVLSNKNVAPNLVAASWDWHCVGCRIGTSTCFCIVWKLPVVKSFRPHPDTKHLENKTKFESKLKLWICSSVIFTLIRQMMLMANNLS